MSWFDNIVNKINPAQPAIHREEGTDVHTDSVYPLSMREAYNTITIVNRAVNFLVDACASIDLDVGDKLDYAINPGIRRNKLTKLLNFSANPHISQNELRRALYLDIITDGNGFLYYDSVHLYNIPAYDTKIKTDKIHFIKGYEYKNDHKFKADEIVRIKDNSISSLYRGTSRLESAKSQIENLSSMLEFHTNFFKNGAIPGLILKSPNILNKKIKDRLLDEWTSKYNPKTGGRRPIIVDGDLSIERLSASDIRELDFSASVKTAEEAICKSIGVPHLLLSSGNNANIQPNMKMFYTDTVLPLVNKVVTSLELYFGYDIKPITQNVIQLRPDLKELANYYTSLVNSGILTRNEAREKLRFEASDSEIADELILPANIAGNAANPSQAEGAPKKEPEEANT